MNRTRALLMVASACALTAIAALLGRPTPARTWTEASVSIMTVLSVSAALFTERAKAVLEQRHENAREVARVILRLQGRTPFVGDITDPLTLGVHPAGPGGTGPVPPYVSRDIDFGLRHWLRSTGFILVVGEACAGKTRTAFEAMRDVLPGHLLLVPSPGREVAAAIEMARDRTDCVLWLDDFPVFLRNGHITRKDVTELLARPRHHRVVLATMRADDEIRLTGGLTGDTQLMDAGRGLMDLAWSRRLFMDRLLSASELMHARQLAASDERLAAALVHADRVGIGEYMAQGPQLFAQWEDAWGRGIQPRGAALIAAAVDCRLAGFISPLPRGLLTALHENYLNARGGAALLPGDLDAAWDWAMSLKGSGSAPLQPLTDETCDIFGYLVDEHRRRHGGIAPERCARAALAEAGPADANSIAVTAWRQRRERLARDALRRQYQQVSQVMPPDHPVRMVLRVNLTVTALGLNGYQAGLPAAEGEFRKILNEAVGKPGDDPDFGPTVRGKLANVLFAQGRLPESEAEYRTVIQARTSALGEEHPRTLISRNNLALVLTEMGKLEAAEAELRAVLTIRQRTLGRHHQDTEVNESNLAAVLRRKANG